MAFHLAQLNVARLLHPLDHLRIKEFMDGLALINVLPGQSPGFVWRLQTDSGNGTGVHRPWSKDPFAKRSDWFEKPNHAQYLLCWVPVRSNGASPNAFWFGKLFPAQLVEGAPASLCAQP